MWVFDDIVYYLNIKGESREVLLEEVKERIDQVNTLEGMDFYLQRLKNKESISYIKGRIVNIEKKFKINKLEQVQKRIKELQLEEKKLIQDN